MGLQYISGCSAAAEAVRLSNVDVIAAYPITPQTHIVQTLSQDVFNGRLNAEFVAVEGEHSAMSATVGAAMTGARAFTASSSQGLAYMHEVLYYASGLRLPIVMVVANRSMASPVSIFVDHQDSLPQRDTGFLQYYAENCQDILDLVLIAYKVAEDRRVLLPVMVCCDGFYLSHVSEPVDVPSAADVARFIPKGTPNYPFLDVDAPKLFNVMAFPEHFEEFQRDKYVGMEESAAVFDEANEAFFNIFGRRHNRMETYCMEDAEYALVGLGSMMGTTRSVINDYRAKGVKVGMISVKAYRPFPVREIFQALRHCKRVGVLDRDVAFGSGGILYSDVCRSLIHGSGDVQLVNFILGLGGRDVTRETLSACYERLMSAEDSDFNENDVLWPDENKALWQVWRGGK